MQFPTNASSGGKEEWNVLFLYLSGVHMTLSGDQGVNGDMGYCGGESLWCDQCETRLFVLLFIKHEQIQGGRKQLIIRDALFDIFEICVKIVPYDYYLFIYYGDM